jgi:Tfp pilus assembly protein PilX
MRNLTTRTQPPKQRSGFALLFSMFILSLITVMVLSILDTTTLELSAVRNSMDYERALHLANAGVHHAAAMLEADDTWLGIVESVVAYGTDDTYRATAVAGTFQTVVVTSSGVSGSVIRTIQATIEL